MTEISKEVSELESLLGLPDGFYNNLLAEDDWSFVIKLSALFEAASGQALATKLQHPEIESSLSYLEQANPKYGKVTLMFQLDIINKEQSAFLTKLAELRNKLIHNISEVSFDWNSYIAEMDNNQKNSFAKVFGHGIYENFKVQGVSVNRTNFTIENPKMVIWLTANEIFACLHADIRGSKAIQKINEIGVKLVKNITRKIHSDG
jgi:hypothetical protein